MPGPDGDAGFLGGVSGAVLAWVGRAGPLPVTEHRFGNRSHAVGFISDQPVS